MVYQLGYITADGQKIIESFESEAARILAAKSAAATAQAVWRTENGDVWRRIMAD